jgi:hypothetical protein
MRGSPAAVGRFCGQAHNLGVKVVRFADIGRVEADMIDSGDARALRVFLRDGVKRGQLKKQPPDENDCGVLQVNARNSNKPLHDTRFYTMRRVADELLR